MASGLAGERAFCQRGLKSGFNFVHLPRQFFRRQNLLLKEDIGERDDPALVVFELAVDFGAEALDPSPLFFGADDFVAVENVGERVATLFPQQIVMPGKSPSPQPMNCECKSKVAQLG